MGKKQKQPVQWGDWSEVFSDAQSGRYYRQRQNTEGQIETQWVEGSTNINNNASGSLPPASDSEDAMAVAFGQVALDQGLGAGGEEDAAVQLAIDQSRREQDQRRYAGESSASYPPYGAGTQVYGASGQAHLPSINDGQVWSGLSTATPMDSALVRGNRNSMEASRFRVYRSDQFPVGRVVKVHWAQPHGNSRAGITAPSVETCQPKNKPPFHITFRRFVIVAQYRGSSTALPINTYGGNGCLNKGSHAGYHGIICDSRNTVSPLHGEPPLGHRTVRVHMFDNETLSAESRINYVKPSTLEHNYNVQLLGDVHPEDLEILLQNWSYYFIATGQ